MSNHLSSRIYNSRRSGFNCWLALILACLGIGFLVPASVAQTNAPTTPSNRWLMVVETSKYTRSHSNELALVAAAIVSSSMNGQVHPGDTFGLWTYNSSLVEGQFPLQVLEPGTIRRAAHRVHEYIAAQRFENRTHLNKALPDILQIIKDSDFITVIILGTGTEEIKGTPFDEKINSACATLQKERKKNEMPIAVVLRASHGTITDFRVMMPNFNFDLPQLPPELKPANPAESSSGKTAKPAPVAPLIMSGSKVISAPVTNEVPGEITKP